VFARLFAAFTIIPLIDVLILIPLGQEIGLLPTIAIVVLTAIVGSWLGSREGSAAWRRIQEDLAHGRLPGDSVLDGLLIAMACALLITPGILTDAFGLVLLIPISRAPLRKLVKRKFTNMLQNPEVTVIDLSAGMNRWTNDDVIDITPSEPLEKDLGKIDAH